MANLANIFWEELLQYRIERQKTNDDHVRAYRRHLWNRIAVDTYDMMNWRGYPEPPRILCKRCKRDYTSNPLRGVERCICELHG